MDAETSVTSPVWIDLLDISRNTTASGPQWAHESDDLDMTLVSWADGKGIEAHINHEVDVVWIGVEGEGIATIDGHARELRPGVAVLIPKGVVRGVRNGAARFSYLSLHRRRAGLRPTLGRGGRTL